MQSILKSLGKVLPHNCSESTFRENLKSLAAKDQKAAEHIVTNVIATKQASSQGTEHHSKAYG